MAGCEAVAGGVSAVSCGVEGSMPNELFDAMMPRLGLALGLGNGIEASGENGGSGPSEGVKPPLPVRLGVASEERNRGDSDESARLSALISCSDPVQTHATDQPNNTNTAQHSEEMNETLTIAPFIHSSLQRLAISLKLLLLLQRAHLGLSAVW